MKALVCITVFGFSLSCFGAIENFVSIPAGVLQMGSDVFDPIHLPDERPRHAVAIPRDFEMQAHEVTQSQWMEVMGGNPSYFKEKRYCPETFTGNMCPHLPVDSVTWFMAKDFIAKLNTRDSVYMYRLPTEAEWEWAARGGTSTTYFFGSTDASLKDYAWYDEDYDKGQTHTVGAKRPNPYGLYDIYGNVSEWTEDAYSFYAGSDLEPIPNDVRRVLRGGDWFSQSWRTRSAFRSASLPDHHNEMMGLRMVRSSR